MACLLAAILLCSQLDVEHGRVLRRKLEQHGSCQVNIWSAVSVLWMCQAAQGTGQIAKQLNTSVITQICMNAWLCALHIIVIGGKLQSYCYVAVDRLGL